MNEYGFVPFCKREGDRIIKTITRASRNIAPKMNLPDYRFNISNLFCHAISKEFTRGGEGGDLRSVYDKGYDLIFADQTKISVKIQQEIFQKSNKNETLSVPKDIILKNCLGGNADNRPLVGFDFLLCIQRGKYTSDGVIWVGFGVVSIDKLTKTTLLGEQIKVKLENQEYDYFSGLHKIILDDNLDRQSEKNRRFTEGISKTYDSLLEME
jgi:hypothetical protein